MQVHYVEALVAGLRPPLTGLSNSSCEGMYKSSRYSVTMVPIFM
jgi:hypothetical protein